jgi:hypothetical protein
MPLWAPPAPTSRSGPEGIYWGELEVSQKLPGMLPQTGLYPEQTMIVVQFHQGDPGASGAVGPMPWI